MFSIKSFDVKVWTGLDLAISINLLFTAAIKVRQFKYIALKCSFLLWNRDNWKSSIHYFISRLRFFWTAVKKLQVTFPAHISSLYIWRHIRIKKKKRKKDYNYNEFNKLMSNVHFWRTLYSIIWAVKLQVTACSKPLNMIT